MVLTNTTQQAAFLTAQRHSNYDQKPHHVIDTHGKGFEIQPEEFQLDRKYYHGKQGEKMRFTYIGSVVPKREVLQSERYLLFSEYDQEKADTCSESLMYLWELGRGVVTGPFIHPELNNRAFYHVSY